MPFRNETLPGRCPHAVPVQGENTTAVLRRISVFTQQTINSISQLPSPDPVLHPDRFFLMGVALFVRRPTIETPACLSRGRVAFADVSVEVHVLAFHAGRGVGAAAVSGGEAPSVGTSIRCNRHKLADGRRGWKSGRRDFRHEIARDALVDGRGIESGRQRFPA